MPASSVRVPDRVAPPLKPEPAHAEAAIARMIGSEPCRRSVLAGLSAPALAAALPAMAGGTHPDAELLRLGRELDAINATWFAFRPEYETASAARDRAFENNADAMKAARLRGNAAADELAERLGGRHEPVIRRGNRLADEADALCEQITRLRPQTLEGFAVTLRAMATWHVGAWDREPFWLEWDDLLVRTVVDTGLALAGVDRLGQPVAAA